MKRSLRKAFTALKKIGAPVFERSDEDGFVLSAEDNNDRIWADYYNEFGIEIAEDVQKICDDNDVLLEWETPGGLIAYEA